jgi:ketosteroid isomerase-like protein
MTPAEQLKLVKDHYALNAAGDYHAAGKLLTDDFFITIPTIMRSRSSNSP